MPDRKELEAAVRAAYRLGALDSLLHKDTVKALKPPGLILQSMEGEREYRLNELESKGKGIVSNSPMTTVEQFSRIANVDIDNVIAYTRAGHQADVIVGFYREIDAMYPFAVVAVDEDSGAVLYSDTIKDSHPTTATINAELNKAREAVNAL